MPVPYLILAKICDYLGLDYILKVEISEILDEIYPMYMKNYLYANSEGIMKKILELQEELNKMRENSYCDFCSDSPNQCPVCLRKMCEDCYRYKSNHCGVCDGWVCSDSCVGYWCENCHEGDVVCRKCSGGRDYCSTCREKS